MPDDPAVSKFLVPGTSSCSRRLYKLLFADKWAGCGASQQVPAGDEPRIQTEECRNSTGVLQLRMERTGLKSRLTAAGLLTTVYARSGHHKAACRRSGERREARRNH